MSRGLSIGNAKCSESVQDGHADPDLGDLAIEIAGGRPLTDSIGIEAVYQLCAFLPLAGVLTWFLPRIEER